MKRNIWNVLTVLALLAIVTLVGCGPKTPEEKVRPDPLRVHR